MAKSTRWIPWAGWDLELVPSQALPAAHTTPGDCSLNEREGARAPGVGRPAKGGSGQTGRGRGRQAHRQPRRRREHLAAGGGGGRSSICSLVIWLSGSTPERRGAPQTLRMASLWSTANVIQSSLLNRASVLPRQQRVAWSLSSWSPFNHRRTPRGQGATEAPL